MTGAGYAGLDLLASAVVVLDADLRIAALNLAAESLFAINHRSAVGQRFTSLFESDGGALTEHLEGVLAQDRGFIDPDLTLTRTSGEQLHLSCLATPVESTSGRLLLELRRIDQQLRVEREALRLTQSEASRELIRNLAHEIKNPLGGLRGSAQLLERELDRPELREYTQVIIKEADRL
ncbi:MAG: histidine kinase dimerization/phospho-acceptor domain-containing protein, partial [Burkholderiales bacterium]